MARLILKSPYMKPGGGNRAGNYVRYIATREGVEMAEDTSAHLPATDEQKKQITRCIKKYADSKELLEYADYLSNPTRGNAYALLDCIAEIHNEKLPERDVYLKYISERPGVEKVGTNGLFTDEGVPIVLSQVQKEMNESQSNIWTHIISLHREDAERLGLNTADAWMHLLRSQRNMIAQQMKITPENFRWYAAFHNESHHPHVHMMAYSINPNEAYLSKQGIETIKSNLAKEIFRQDLLQIYQKQTDYRDELRQESRQRLTEIVDEINRGGLQNPRMQEMMVQLSDKLSTTTGKKVYGYLKPEVKKLVDSIVSELCNDERIQELYRLWYEMREDVLRTYTDKFPERIPLEKNKEFKSIRNAVIQQAMKISIKEAPNLLMDLTINADQHEMESIETFFQSAVRFAEELPAQVEQETPSRPSRNRKGIVNWWTDEYRLARKMLCGGKDELPRPEKAYGLLTAEAERGNPLAMHDLGRMLHLGQGCDKNEIQAQDWFEKAYNGFYQIEQTAQDPGYWQYRIGKMHADGYGVEQDFQEAADWYEQAIAWNNPFAAYALGSMYHYGRGVEKNEDRAFELFRLAAEHPKNPNAYAQYQLGLMCSEGVGTEENRTAAEKWYRLAYQGFLKVEQTMPDDKLYYRLGCMNLYGLGTEVNIELAERYFHKAAVMGNVDAVYGMGKLNLETDVEQAIRYFELAAKQGHSYAEYQLGKIYCFGQGIPRNLETGMEWLKSSAEHGNSHATVLLRHVQDDLSTMTLKLSFGLLQGLAEMIETRAEAQYEHRRHIDSKLKRQINEKKQRLGQRTQEEYQGMHM